MQILHQPFGYKCGMRILLIGYLIIVIGYDGTKIMPFIAEYIASNHP